MINVIIAGFVVSIVWFVLGALLYMNPMASSLARKYGKKPGVRQWKNSKDMLSQWYFVGVLIPSMIFAFVFYFIRPALTQNLWYSTLYFGLILVGIKVVPEFVDKKIMTTYPQTLGMFDVLNGTITCFVISLVLSLML